MPVCMSYAFFNVIGNGLRILWLCCRGFRFNLTIAACLLSWPHWSAAQTNLVLPGFTEVEFNEHYDLFIDSQNIWQTQGIEKLSDEARFVPYHKRFLKIRSSFPLVLAAVGRLTINNFPSLPIVFFQKNPKFIPGKCGK